MKINKTKESIHFKIDCEKPGEETSINTNIQSGAYHLLYQYQPNDGQIHRYQHYQHNFLDHYRFILFPHTLSWKPFYFRFYGSTYFFFLLSSNRHHKLIIINYRSIKSMCNI